MRLAARARYSHAATAPHPALTWGDPTLPTALNGFTSEFGMESGGSRSLLSSGNSDDVKLSLYIMFLQFGERLCL